MPLESPPSWPAAALQAQAIVARTFALARRSLSRPYDVRADESDQRWGGVEAEAPAATAAIQATRGRTLAYGGGPASGVLLLVLRRTHGRHRPRSGTARRCRTCAASTTRTARRRRSTAGRVRSTSTAPSRRSARGPAARWSGTALTDPDPTGRPRAVTLLGTTVATMPVADFRRALGTDVVRSLWLRSVRIDATQAAPRLVIEGSGRGHGVGLCQWGANFFAASGASAAEILAFYFPGTSVTSG